MGNVGDKDFFKNKTFIDVKNKLEEYTKNSICKECYAKSICHICVGYSENLILNQEIDINQCMKVKEQYMDFVYSYFYLVDNPEMWEKFINQYNVYNKRGL